MIKQAILFILANLIASFKSIAFNVVAYASASSVESRLITETEIMLFCFESPRRGSMV